jgi:hypothetical protein
MTLGIALLLIFILYLIDKHNQWRRAARVGLGILALAIFAAAAIYAWNRHTEKLAQGYEKEGEELYNKEHQSDDTLVIERPDRKYQTFKKSWSQDRIDDYFKKQGFVKGADGKWLSKIGQATENASEEPLEPSGANASLTENKHVVVGPDGKHYAFSKDVSSKRIDAYFAKKFRHVKVLRDADLTTEEFGSLKSGHLKKDEIATLLVDDGGWMKVKTAAGGVGWSSSDSFEVIAEEK